MYISDDYRDLFGQPFYLALASADYPNVIEDYLRSIDGIFNWFPAGTTQESTWSVRSGLSQHVVTLISNQRPELLYSDGAIKFQRIQDMVNASRLGLANQHTLTRLPVTGATLHSNGVAVIKWNNAEQRL